jgi:dTDP-4-dehydrorhamnose reductase
MKIVILGSNGQLGQKLKNDLNGKFNLFTFNKKELDITNLNKVSNVIKSISPDIIINTSAYTAVDKAEDEKKLAFEINEMAVRNIAKISKNLDCFLIHYSTDYVFDGKKKSPYAENDTPNPINVYGNSKLKGEKAISEINGKYYILRLSWVIGENSSNFVNKILELSLEKSELKVVNDQIGVPSSTLLISKVTENLIETIYKKKPWPYGIYHLAPKGATNWYEIAKIFLKFAKNKGLLLKTDPDKIIAISSGEFPTKAARPKNSIFNTEKIEKEIKFDLPHWSDDFINISKNILNNYISK